MPLTPLPQTIEAPAASCALGAVTARRVAMLDEMAEDAHAMGRMVRRQVGRCSWVDPKDAFMFSVFDRAMRQSIMLAAKLETDARRLACGEAPARGHDAAAPEAAGLAYDEVTARRAAMLEAMAAEAVAMGKVVRAQAEKPDWIDVNDAFLFNRFNRAARQAIMLAEKLEADARRLAAAAPDDAARAPAAPAGADDAGAKQKPQAADRADEPAVAEAADAPATLDRLHALPNKPVGVVVAGICRKLGRRQDLREFTDAELGHDRERCQEQAAGPRSHTRLPDGWIEGVDGQPVKIGVERKDMFDATLLRDRPTKRGSRWRDPPD